MKKLFITLLSIVISLSLIGFNANTVFASEITVGTGGTYSDMSVAISNASSSDTICLLNNLTTDITINSGKNITIDLKGNKITGYITNSGTLTLKSSSGDGTISSTGQLSNLVIENKVGSTLTIEDNVVVNGQIYVNQSVLYIKGGKFSNTGINKIFTVSKPYTILISGGLFLTSECSMLDVVNYPIQYDLADHCDTNYIVVSNDDSATSSAYPYKVVYYAPVVVSEPQPEPVYKDETCEAVVGPRWHWNEAKGVCQEEYSVINTATK